jgi:hypothetical protein
VATEIESTRVQLLRVQMAIAKIEEGAQDYQIGNRRLSRGDLATLYKREAELKTALAEEEMGGGMVVTYAATGME